MKICIVKLSAMGDIIHSMVALQFIKKQIPKAQIDWIVEEGFKCVLENNPHIDNILPVNLKSIKKEKSKIFDQLKLLKEYAKNNYDVVIDAQGLIKSAIVSKVIGGHTVGSFIAGFDKDSIREGIASWFYDKKVFIPYEKNVIERSVKVICEPLGLKMTKEDILTKEPFLYYPENISFKLQPSSYILFVVGASKINKIYPKEKFLELAQRLDQKILVVWGNEEEYETALWLSKNCENCELDSKGNLDDLKLKIQNARLVIGGDTGPTHMAWALNVPSITIFGNTPQHRNTYITDINKVIKSDSYVDPLKLDKNDFSIEEIKASEIVSIAKGLLK
ncbi:MAG: lipopolysaccharide heptosyltransferase I [Campylobacterota bacterium]|nr:lipopolysaccharide heptosyltransferase I [Campylobacterota bacterium]